MGLSSRDHVPSQAPLERTILHLSGSEDISYPVRRRYKQLFSICGLLHRFLGLSSKNRLNNQAPTGTAILNLRTASSHVPKYATASPHSLPLDQCLPNFSARWPLLASKNNHSYSHQCSRIYTVSGWTGIQNYLRTDFRDIRRILTHTCSIRNNALHDLTLLKMIIASCVQNILIQHSNGHTK